MKTITLINPPSPFLLSEDVGAPLGIMYLAAYLRKQGVKVEICDLKNKNIEHWQPSKSDIYGISFVTAGIKFAKRIGRKIKKYFPKSLIVVGGTHSTALPERTLLEEKSFDIAISGEGEEPLFRICKGDNFRDIDGLFFKEKDKILSFKKRKLLPDLDLLPFPARDMLDIKSYNPTIDSRPKGKIYRQGVSLITARGCPFNCSFCASTVMWNHMVRFRSAENVIDEIEELLEQNFDALCFMDDTFIIKKNRLYKILDVMEKKGGIPFRCLARTTDLDLETLKKLKLAGCIQIDLGQESGSQRILDINNKKTKVEDGYKACSLCKKVGIITKVCLILGLPGENEESIEETRNFIKKSEADGYTLASFVPYPGCAIFENPSKYNYSFNHNVSFGQYQQIAKDEKGTGKILAPNKEELKRWGSELLKEMGNKAFWLEYKRRAENAKKSTVGI